MKLNSISIYFLLLVAANVQATNPMSFLGTPDDSTEWDLNGRTLFSDRKKGKYARIELPEGIPPIYILKVVFIGGTVITRRIVGI